MGNCTCGKVTFFILWLLLWLAAIALLLLNVKWHDCSIAEIVMAVVIAVFSGLLLVDVMEGMAMAIVTICLLGRARKERRGDGSRLTAILNYNLLAYCKKDIDDCYERMYQAFLGNLSENVSAVLVSVTVDKNLRRYELECRDKYRRFIYSTLFGEGRAYLRHDNNDIEYIRLINYWTPLETRVGRSYLSANLETICQKVCTEFMCIHRSSRVLRKCGQYQDLMLLSDGHLNAFTYTDIDLYGPFARTHGEPMFTSTADVQNILNRKYDYTFVLDGDTRLPVGAVKSLLNFAVANPGKGIIQPSIKFEVTIWDTIYMHLEDLRAQLNEPMANCMPRVLGQCGFFGKALINNRIYIDSIIGSPHQLLEKVPVNVMSHDTYEAAILKPHFVSNVSFIERPVYNYLAWNSRLRRWNLGDLILAMFFKPTLFGKPIKALQKCAQKRQFFNVRVRNPIQPDFVTSYICHTPIRAMFVKPYWCVFVIIYTAFLGTKLYYQWVPIIVIMIIIIVFSKIPLLLRCSKALVYIIPELLSSIIQFTAEIIVGFVRIIRVFYALIKGKHIWIPQRYIEEEFDTVNVWKIWVYSWKHLWGYAIFGGLLIIVMILLSVFGIIVPLTYILIIFDLATIFAIPLYCFITSLRICPCAHVKRENEPDKVSLYAPSSVDTQTYSTFRDSTDSTLLLDIDEPGRHNRTNHVIEEMSSGHEQPRIEEIRLVKKESRNPIESTGADVTYEEIIYPTVKEHTYHVSRGDSVIEYQSLKKKAQKRSDLNFVSWETKDNPVFHDEAFEYECIDEPNTVTNTVYKVNEKEVQGNTRSLQEMQVNRQRTLEDEWRLKEEMKKENELRDALMKLDTAINDSQEERRVETDGISTRYIRRKMMETKENPVNITDRHVTYRLEEERKGHAERSYSPRYADISPPSEMRYETVTVKTRSEKPQIPRQDSNTTTLELWSDKSTTASMISSGNLLAKDVRQPENLDVYTWLHANRGESTAGRTSAQYEDIPLRSAARGAGRDTFEVIQYSESVPHQEAEKVTPSYFGSLFNSSPVPQEMSQRSMHETKQSTSASTFYGGDLRESSENYQTSIKYGALYPTQVQTRTYGTLEDRTMSEGTLINKRLYENLAQWHTAMDKTMDSSDASTTQAEEKIAYERTQSDLQQDNCVSYKAERRLNMSPRGVSIIPKRHDTIMEEVGSDTKDRDIMLMERYSTEVTRDTDPEITSDTEYSGRPDARSPIHYITTTTEETRQTIGGNAYSTKDELPSVSSSVIKEGVMMKRRALVEDTRDEVKIFPNIEQENKAQLSKEFDFDPSREGKEKWMLDYEKKVSGKASKKGKKSKGLMDNVTNVNSKIADDASVVKDFGVKKAVSTKAFIEDKASAVTEIGRGKSRAPANVGEEKVHVSTAYRSEKVSGAADLARDKFSSAASYGEKVGGVSDFGRKQLNAVSDFGRGKVSAVEDIGNRQIGAAKQIGRENIRGITEHGKLNDVTEHGRGKVRETVNFARDKVENFSGGAMAPNHRTVGMTREATTEKKVVSNFMVEKMMSLEAEQN